MRERLAVAWSRARELVVTGRVRVDGAIETDAARRVPDPACVAIDLEAPRIRRGTLPAEAIVFVDRDIVVVDKPAGVSTVPYEEGEKDTLVDRVRAALRRRGGGYDPQLGVVHRLDKETSGLLVFTRTLAAKKHLDLQMRRHSSERVYVAIAHGDVPAATHRSWLIEDRGDGLRGSWGVFRAPRGPRPDDAREAITHVEPIERLRGATLVRCRLETGRQHQIRIHLSEAGHPILGERVYVRGFQRALLPAPRVMLHAYRLVLVHPKSEEEMAFEREPPADFAEVLAGLRMVPPRNAGRRAVRPR